MDKSYTPADIESRWYETWDRAGYFAPQQGGDPFCIMLPPPNVTGTLHMGHAFQYTIMDVLTRFQRMRGKSALWQPGMDHAGIATQMVVERLLATQGTSRHDLGREAFEKAVWDWKEKSGGTIQKQMRRLGASVDWRHEVFTMDEDLSEAVRKVFVDLYQDGLIYRGKRLVNWDPVLHTALSDLEVISAQENGKLWHIRYPRTDGQGHVVVATTRPETLLGDCAVAVNPDDERYRQLVGQQLELPLTGRSIPVIVDEYVDMEFGTGCVKITPAHDFNDYEMGKRHKLPLINVLNDDASLNENAPREYRGMDRFEARAQIVADLDAAGLLEKIENHQMVIPRGDRSGAIIEPYLTDQWYVRISPLAEPAIKAVEDGAIQFVPKNWSKTYFDWMHRIEDWCISRQLWWGHRVPAWYDADGGIHVGMDEADARHRSGLGPDVQLTQDEDVLDTWFSSALWPFTTLGWPQESGRLERFYPTTVLVTGFDIIFFWVARMIMMGLRFIGEVPFHKVYIHGLIRDSQGQKMSKSKGNVLDPIDLIDGIDLESLVAKRTSDLMQPQMAPAIEKATRAEFPQGIPAFGCDALRFTFAALATTGRDIRFDLGRIEGYRNFCNKIWNAARYVLLQTEGHTVTRPRLLSVADRWILSRTQKMLAAVNEHLDAYRLDLASQALYEFIWNEYCDWYLELSKPSLQRDEEMLQNATRHTLLTVLEISLRALHPFMPFITEEIWQRVKGPLDISGESIMIQPCPQLTHSDEKAEQDINWFKRVLQGIRQIRSELNLAPALKLAVQFQSGDNIDHQRFEQFEPLLAKLGRVRSFAWISDEDDTSNSAVALVGGLKVLIPLGGLVDVKAELLRIEKLMTREQADLERSQAKLANRKFVENAPAAVVQQEKQRLADHQANVERLKGQMQQLESMKD